MSRYPATSLKTTAKKNTKARKDTGGKAVRETLPPLIYSDDEEYCFTGQDRAKGSSANTDALGTDSHKSG
ncbi:hypothetical protein FRC11_000299 [Ceratobasidium sp. 423]|nr:hypothetical protein FRC11_000299 [Ceratobasidium sp. 423]